VKISNKKISFFSTRNQYFPHIPYVASKNKFEPEKKSIFHAPSPTAVDRSLCHGYKS
jgi:hypothetical protein